MDIRSSFAAQNYAATRPATAAAELGESQSGATQLVRNFAEVVQEGEQVAVASMTGDASPHALVQSLAQTEIAIEAAVTIRDKVVEAYQEILRMPV